MRSMCPQGCITFTFFPCFSFKDQPDKPFIGTSEIIPNPKQNRAPRLALLWHRSGTPPAPVSGPSEQGATKCKQQIRDGNWKCQFTMKTVKSTNWTSPFDPHQTRKENVSSGCTWILMGFFRELGEGGLGSASANKSLSLGRPTATVHTDMYMHMHMYTNM